VSDDILSSGGKSRAGETPVVGTADVNDLGELDVDFGEGPDEEYFAQPRPSRWRSLLAVVSAESLAITSLILTTMPVLGVSLILRLATKLAGIEGTRPGGENNVNQLESLRGIYAALSTAVAVLAVVAGVAALLRNRDEVRWVTGVAGAAVLLGLLIAVVQIVTGSDIGPYGIY
jgi:hypothetical protein